MPVARNENIDILPACPRSQGKGSSSAWRARIGKGQAGREDGRSGRPTKRMPASQMSVARTSPSSTGRTPLVFACRTCSAGPAPRLIGPGPAPHAPALPPKSAMTDRKGPKATLQAPHSTRGTCGTCGTLSLSAALVNRPRWGAFNGGALKTWDFFGLAFFYKILVKRQTRDVPRIFWYETQGDTCMCQQEQRSSWCACSRRR